MESDMNQSDTHKGPDAQKIKSMFAEIAGDYDRANDILSAGIHHLWRKKFVRLSGVTPNDKVLDCATGTGDLAIEFKRSMGEGSGQVVATDFCKEMLESAPAKAKSKNLEIDFSVADVTKLPFEDDSFDISSISFGIRNVDQPQLGIDELARVTRPGGNVMVLEFGQIAIPLLREMYGFYSNKILPALGGLVTGKKEAYSYLQESSSQFPCRGEFLDLMNKTGRFEKTEFHTLSAGIAYIYIGHVKTQ